ncbi:MAG: exosome complex RNA-binding protein Csl4 [Promethearchaeota archaeon]
MSEHKSGDFVQIGDEIVSENEYLSANESTYIENGKIIAATSGNLKFNKRDRTVQIESQNEEKRKFPQPGDIVLGDIYMIRKSAVGVHLNVANNRLILDLGLIGNIHVSEVSRGYIDKLDDVFQKTDVVRARVTRKSRSEYRIATNDSNLGVVKATCKYCGKVMVRKGRNQVICPFCSHVERKILANDYGDVDIMIKF